jgi:hypothetical protein
MENMGSGLFIVRRPHSTFRQSAQPPTALSQVEIQMSALSAAHRPAVVNGTNALFDARFAHR